MKHRQPALLDQFGCRLIRRALVKENFKLIHVDDRPNELFALDVDPAERQDLLPQQPAVAATLNDQLNRIGGMVETQRNTLTAGDAIDIDEDEALLQHLRGLGYID